MRPRGPAPDPSDGPLVEEVPTHGPVAFEPRPVGSRGRGRVPLAAWTAVVMVGLAVGVLGRTVGPSPERVAIDVRVPADGSAAPSASPTDPDGSLGSSAVGVPLAESDPIVLSTPAWGPVVVTSHRLDVEGLINAHAVAADVSLEARGARTVATEHVSFPTVFDGIRPESPPEFHVWFDIPNPRPNGTMWVTVTLYGPDGLPIAGIRRPFVAGPLLEANALPSPR